MKKISNTLIFGPDADPGLALTGVWKYKGEGEVCRIWCSGELCLKWLPISFNIEEKKVRMINWDRTAIVKRLEVRKTRVKGMRNVEMWIYDPVVCWSQIVPGKESQLGECLPNSVFKEIMVELEISYNARICTMMLCNNKAAPIFSFFLRSLVVKHLPDHSWWLVGEISNFLFSWGDNKD